MVSNSDQPVSAGEMWKITNAYAVGGPACTVKAVQQLTGLRIDRVIGIDFVGFQAMVDAVGGVEVNMCRPIIDAELGTVIPTAGEQLIHGDTALSLVRARKVEGDPTGDLGRIRRQQVVLSALLRQVTSAGTLLSPARLNAFLQAFVQNTYTDNVTVDDLVALAQSFGTPDPCDGDVLHAAHAHQRVLSRTGSLWTTPPRPASSGHWSTTSRCRASPPSVPRHRSGRPWRPLTRAWAPPPPRVRHPVPPRCRR